jgi:carbamoyl-phosphate synthase large subunit
VKRLPKRTDLEKVLVIGSGGIVIGQAAEFDYSGSQALKALDEESIETVLVNPNVATIQTSHRMADKVYLEPCTPEIVAQIIRMEKPDGILLGFGGQTGLNVGVQLEKKGIFKDEDVEVLGTGIEAIEATEDRDLFKRAMERIGVPVPLSDAAYSVDDCLKIAGHVGYPVIVRVAYTLGGGGSGVAHNESELKEIAERALNLSIEHQVLVERYLEHWKEIEYEVMRDSADNTITVAALENLDPLGIHTGDSIVVAPTQTLTNSEYQILRDASIRVIKDLGIIGECNIQFGLDPKSERYVAIEVNARLSRSSALASKATGYPLAYISAKLAVGYLLPELRNKVTGVTTACFEPSLDYVIVKVPRWDFQKFINPDTTIGSQMKSVGEVMGIGRSFEEALQKAIRELEIGKIGLLCNDDGGELLDPDELRKGLHKPTDERLFLLPRALEAGISVNEIEDLTGINKWFIFKIKNILDMEKKLKSLRRRRGKPATLIKSIREAKSLGFSDEQIGRSLGLSETDIRKLRKKNRIMPSFKIIDTMAAEWPSRTNYCYVTHGDGEDDIDFSELKSKLLVLGAGCIRIGSSVEFDYCTMNTVWAMKGEGIDEIIVLNNNPETVSTDFDMSDKLYFEEMTLERVMDIVDREAPSGVVVSVGGQTPNNLALSLARNGVKIVGTTAQSIDMAEDRSKFSAIISSLGIRQPLWRSLTSTRDILRFSNRVGYPVIVRPSYVLSGASMRIAHNRWELIEYIGMATKVSKEYPVVISKFIEGAKEVEVDAVSDEKEVLIGAIIEHVELAGTHSGDANMVIPPQTLDRRVVKTIEEYVEKMARALRIKGPFNVQFLVKNGEVSVIELNLRASRSMPYTSKATGIPLIWAGAKVILGKTLRELNLKKKQAYHVAVKSPTFSFARLKGADPVLGVEMTSTGEVACIDYDFPSALIKSLMSSGMRLPSAGKKVLVTVRDEDKPRVARLVEMIKKTGYQVAATTGTAQYLKEHGVDDVRVFGKLSRGRREIIDETASGEIGLIVNTVSYPHIETVTDGFTIRRTAAEFLVPVLTRIETAEAFFKALEREGFTRLVPRPLEEYLAQTSVDLI